MVVVKFEDLKVDFDGQLKTLREFFGRLVRREGVADQIKRLCSINRLNEVEANKKGSAYSLE